jgi:hypothetical protein
MNPLINPIRLQFPKVKVLNALVATLFFAPSVAFCDTVTVSDYTELRKALAEATAGRIIKLNSGVYAPPSAPTQWPTLDGSVTTSPMFLLHDVSNVTIEAAAANPTSAQKPLLKAPSRTNNYVFYGQRVHGLKLKNLRMQNADKGAVIDRSDNVKIEGVEIFNTGTEGLHFRDGSDYAEVWNSSIAHTGMERADRGEGLYLCNDRKMWNSYYQPTPKVEDRMQNCDFAKIHNNTFGPNIGAEPIDIKEGTVGIRIYDNHFIMKMDDAGLLATDVVNLPKYAIHMKGTEAIVDNNTFDFTGAVSTLQAAISVDQQLDDDPALAYIHGYYNWAVNNKVTGNNSSHRVFKAASDGGATYGCNSIAGSGLVDEVPSNNTAPARRYIPVSGANCVPPAVPGDSSGTSSSASSVATSSSSSSASSAAGVGATIQAESYSTMIGTLTVGAQMGGWGKSEGLAFNNVNFNGVTSIDLNLSGINAGHIIEIRKGSQTGTLLGSYTMVSTGSWNTYVTKNVPLTTTATGTGTLVIYVANSSASSNALNLDWIKLSATGATSSPASSSSSSSSSAASGSCQTIGVTTAVELDLSASACVNFTSAGGLVGKTFAVWDSDTNTSCDFRGDITTNGGSLMTVTSNYVAATNMVGTQATFASSNGCKFVKVRAY